MKPAPDDASMVCTISSPVFCACSWAESIRMLWSATMIEKAPMAMTTMISAAYDAAMRVRREWKSREPVIL
jgi:hypothetical protein